MKKATATVIATVAAIAFLSLWASADEKTNLSESPDGKRVIEPVSEQYSLTDEQKQSFRDRLDSIKTDRKQIFIHGVEGVPNLEIALSADPPTVKDSPERFVPAYVHCGKLVNKHDDGTRTPIKDFPIHYKCVLTTVNEVDITLEGTIRTDQNGFFALLIPDGKTMQFTVPSRKKVSLEREVSKQHE